MKKIILRIIAALTAGAAFICTVASCNTLPDYPTLIEENAYVKAGVDLVINMCQDYYDMSSHKLRESRADNGNYQTTLWPLSSFLEAISEAYKLYPGNNTIKAYYKDALDYCVPKFRVETETLTTPSGTYRNIVYYNAVSGGKGDYYYDDDAWLCYQFLTAYTLFDEDKYLHHAKELLEFFKTGWDDVLGGGIYWDKSFSCKNTCADGPIAVCYLWAYQLTGNVDYLDWGKKIYTWMKKELRNEDGLYIDNIATNGEKNGWTADYNQGTPLYAASLLYSITGEEQYINDALQTAEAALNNSFSVRKVSSGIRVTKKGNPIYKSWCVGWLMRGFREYCLASKKVSTGFEYMENVLNRLIEKVDEDGYYDPFFLSGDKGNKEEVLAPSGVASVFLLCGYYDVYIVTDKSIK